MARVTDIVSAAGTDSLFMCDFSPPRDPSANWLEEARSLKPDLFSVPHLAPHPTRPDALSAAQSIRAKTGTDVVFNIATRDATKPELKDRLARARSLDLQNVIVLQGDADRGIADVDSEDRFTPTGFIRELKSCSGWFCVGAVADLGKDVDKESDLSLRKIDAGADFLLVQPTFDLGLAERFLAQLGKTVPMFFGVQVLARDSIAFSPVPEPVRSEIETSGSGVAAAKVLISQLLNLGINCFYLIAPIYPGGARDYDAVRRVME